MRALIAAATATLLMTCAQAAPLLVETDPRFQGMVKVEASRIDVAYVRPGTRWDKYHSVQFSPLVVTFLAPPENVAELQRIFAEEIRAEFEKNHFIVVDAPRGDTLLVVTRLNQIITNSLSIRLAMLDAASNTVVGAGTDMKFATAIVTDRESKLAQVRAAFRNWAHIISDQIKELAATANANPIDCFRYGTNCK